MPQAKTVLTVPIDGRPTGFFADLSPRHIDLVDAVRTRIDQISGMLWVMKFCDELPPAARNAFGGIETALDDCAALLSVCPAPGGQR